MSSDKDQRSGESGGDDQYAAKREYERVVFQRIMGVYTYVDVNDLKQVEILNISPKGCAFNLRKADGEFEVGEDRALRFYFTLTTYLPAVLNIRYKSESMEDDDSQITYGAMFDQSISTYACLKDFIQVVYSYSKHCKDDNRGIPFKQ